MAAKLTTSAPRWICPECATATLALALNAMNLGPHYGPLLECPECEIGSPLDMWRREEAKP